MTSIRKKLSLLVAPALALAAMAATPAHAGRGAVVYSSGDTIAQVADLPDTANGGLDLGYKYSHFSLFWMPIWGSSEGTYVMYQEVSDGWRSRDLSDSEAQMVATMTNTTLSKPSFFDRFWGSLLIGGVIGLLMLNNLRTNGTLLHHTAVGRRRGA